MALMLWARDRDTLRKQGTSFILWGIALGLFGIAVLSWPGLTGAVLITLIGAFVLIGGLVLAYNTWRFREMLGPLWIADLLWAIAVVIFGLFVLVSPDAVSRFLLMVVAVIMVLKGIFDVLSSIAASPFFSWWWLRLLGGVLLIGFGAWALPWALSSNIAGLVTVGTIVGVWAILAGAVSLTFGILARKA